MMPNKDAYYIISLEKWYEFRTLLFFYVDHKVDSYLFVVLIFNVTTLRILVAFEIILTAIQVNTSRFL